MLIRIFAAVVLILGFGCAHNIKIDAVEMPKATSQAAMKSVGYVITDAQRNLKIIGPGGGGDKVEYYPYRDLEKGLEASLRLLYSEVIVMTNPFDKKSIEDKKIVLIYRPEFITSSGSTSLFTWPPTDFTIHLTAKVLDNDGSEVAVIQSKGIGKAEYSEFKSDFGLAGRRAAADVFQKFVFEVENSKSLKQSKKP